MIVWLRIYLFHDHGSTKLTPLDQILSNINAGVQTRAKPKNYCAFFSTIELKNINEALVYSD